MAYRACSVPYERAIDTMSLHFWTSFLVSTYSHAYASNDGILIANIHSTRSILIKCSLTSSVNLGHVCVCVRCCRPVILVWRIHVGMNEPP